MTDKTKTDDRSVKMQMKEKKKFIFPACILSFLLAGGIVTLAMCLRGIFPGGENAAVFTDTMDQMASMQAMLARQLVRGDLSFYSLTTSLGQNTSLLYAFCAYSPFTLLYILIPDIYTATMLGLILKIALSALCFQLFLERGLGHKASTAVFFSLCYGLCGFQFEYMLSSNLMDALYLLPLVMLALMHALKGKSFLPLTAAYALSFMVQFYSGYAIGIFSFGALLMYLIRRDGKTLLKKNLRFLGKYFISVLCAILLSMVLLLPAIVFFMSGTGVRSVSGRSLVLPWDLLYAMLFGRPTSLTTDIPFIYCGMPVVVLLILYFAGSKTRKRDKLLAAIMCLSLPLSLYISPLYDLLHAFNRPDGFTVRYAFVYVFLFVTIAAHSCRIYGAADGERKKLTVISVAVPLFSLLLLFLHARFGEYDEGKGVGFAFYGIILLGILWCVLIFAVRKKEGRLFRIFAAFLLCGELTAQAYLNCREQGITASLYLHSWDRQVKEFVAEMEGDKSRQDVIYRGHLVNSPFENLSAMYDYMGIGQFASSNYSKVGSMMSRLGDAVMTMRYTQAGATDVTDMLFGIRYLGFLTYADDASREPGPCFEINERALPVGFMADERITAPMAFDGNPLENQNLLLSALCGESIEAYKTAEKFGYEAEGAEYSATDKAYEIRSVSAENYGSVLFGITEEGYEHAYMYLRLLPYGDEVEERRLDADMAMNVSMYSPADRKGFGIREDFVRNNSIIEMTKDGNAFVARLAVFDGPEKTYRYTDQYFCYQDEAELDRACSILGRNTFHADTVKDSYISGKVTATEEQPVLFLTIPYDRGWSVMVDGEAVKPLAAVNECFIALRLSPGEHTVTMVFEAEGAAAGRLLGLSGLIFFLLIFYAEVRKKEHNVHETKKIRHQ